jgi:hypothetical protein
MPLAIFGISSGGLSLAVNLLVLFLVVVWLALIYWTYLDARRRMEDPVLIAAATAASIFPFVGTVVYTIVRPPEYIEDRQERELEIRASELRVRQLIEQSCPHCEYPVERTYLRCPNCERRLRNPCRKCRKPLDPRWGICPYCETEVRRARGERRTAASGARGAKSGARGDRAVGPRPKSRPASRPDRRAPTTPAMRVQGRSSRRESPRGMRGAGGDRPPGAAAS